MKLLDGIISGLYTKDNLINFKGRDFVSRKKVTSLRDVEITKENKCTPTCPNGGRKMTFVLYEKGPPIENEVFFDAN